MALFSWRGKEHGEWTRLAAEMLHLPLDAEPYVDEVLLTHEPRLESAVLDVRIRRNLTEQEYRQAIARLEELRKAAQK